MKSSSDFLAALEKEHLSALLWRTRRKCHLLHIPQPLVEQEVTRQMAVSVGTSNSTLRTQGRYSQIDVDSLDSRDGGDDARIAAVLLFNKRKIAPWQSPATSTQSAQIFRSSLHMSATGQDLEVFQKLTELNHRWSYLSLASVGKVINSSKKKKCLTVKSELETLVQLTRGMNIAGSNDDESDENKRLSRSDK